MFSLLAVSPCLIEQWLLINQACLLCVCVCLGVGFRRCLQGKRVWHRFTACLSICDQWAGGRWGGRADGALEARRACKGIFHDIKELSELCAAVKLPIFSLTLLTWLPLPVFLLHRWWCALLGFIAHFYVWVCYCLSLPLAEAPPNMKSCWVDSVSQWFLCFALINIQPATKACQPSPQPSSSTTSPSPFLRCLLSSVPPQPAALRALFHFLYVHHIRSPFFIIWTSSLSFRSQSQSFPAAVLKLVIIEASWWSCTDDLLFHSNTHSIYLYL